jgi:putative SOS response-associated peptidase YedK
MCGRFTLRAKLNRLLQQFHAETLEEFELAPRFNIAPTQDVVVVRASDHGRELTMMRWGLMVERCEEWTATHQRTIRDCCREARVPAGVQSPPLLDSG